MGRLSLCMIVRDEQEMLPDFLASVAGIWDELIAVDTGSDDETTNILESAGASVLKFVWRDDFAAARNFGLAAATGDWILFLDADERCTPDLGRQIRAIIDDPGAGAATVVMRNLRPDGTRRDTPLLRMFVNDASIRFQHRIHEDPSAGVQAFLGNSGRELRHLSGIVTHLGYLKEVATSRGKKARDMGLLRRALKNDPEDLYSWFKLLEQARFWHDERAWRQAAKGCSRHFAKAVGKGLAHKPWADELTALLAQGLHNQPRNGLKWLDSLPNNLCWGPAVQLRRGLWLETVGDLAAAAEAFSAYHLKADELANDTLFALRSALGMCRIKAANGDLSGAYQQAVQACAACPTDPEALLAAVGFAPTNEVREAWISGHLTRYPEAETALTTTLQALGHEAKVMISNR